MSALAKVTQRTTAAVDGASSKRSRRLFGAGHSSWQGSRPSRRFPRHGASAASVLALFGVLLGFANGTSLLWAVLFAAAHASRREGHPERSNLSAPCEVR